MEAEKKSPKNPKVFHSVPLWFKIVKKGECSAPLCSINFLAYGSCKLSMVLF